MIATLQFCFSLATYFSSNNFNAAAVALRFSGIVFMVYLQQRAASVLDRSWAVCGGGCSGGRWVTAAVVSLLAYKHQQHWEESSAHWRLLLAFVASEQRRSCHWCWCSPLGGCRQKRCLGIEWICRLPANQIQHPDVGLQPSDWRGVRDMTTRSFASCGS